RGRRGGRRRVGAVRRRLGAQAWSVVPALLVPCRVLLQARVRRRLLPRRRARARSFGATSAASAEGRARPPAPRAGPVGASAGALPHVAARMVLRPRRARVAVPRAPRRARSRGLLLARDAGDRGPGRATPGAGGFPRPTGSLGPARGAPSRGAPRRGDGLGWPSRPGTRAKPS